MDGVHERFLGPKKVGRYMITRPVRVTMFYMSDIAKGFHVQYEFRFVGNQGVGVIGETPDQAETRMCDCLTGLYDTLQNNSGSTQPNERTESERLVDSLALAELRTFISPFYLPRSEW